MLFSTKFLFVDVSYLPFSYFVGLTNSVGNSPTSRFTMINKMKASDNVQTQQPQSDVNGNNLLLFQSTDVSFLKCTEEISNTQSVNLSQSTINSISSDSSYNSLGKKKYFILVTF